MGFDLESGEQGDFVLIGFDAPNELRHDMLNEIPRPVEGFHIVNQHLADVLTQVVTDGAGDDVGFLINQEGCRFGIGGFFNGLPQLHQIIDVPLQLFATFADACGAHDQPHAFRHVHAT